MTCNSTFLVAALLLLLFNSCSQNKKNFNASDDRFLYTGRVDRISGDSVVLIGAASAVTFRFAGDSCFVILKNGHRGAEYNYASIEVDGNYLEKIKIIKDTFRYFIPVAPGKNSHEVSIFKATEASVGDILFCGAELETLLEPPALPERKIEFIGNSITCGVGIDWKDYPCGSGEWHDQHNAYWAYGPRVARALRVQFMLSSVSGIGIYRTWNMDGPSMPEVYENRYLNTDASAAWDFSQFNPDVVSICLGTNDLSEGDSIHERKPFEADVFIQHYILFVEMIYHHYPDVQVVLLNSPVFDERKNELLMDCLKTIRDHFNSLNMKKPIRIFGFHDIQAHGCDGHPGKEDHAQMAEQLIPFLKPFFD